MSLLPPLDSNVVEREEAIAGLLMCFGGMLYERGVPLEKAIKGLRVAYEMEAGASKPPAITKKRRGGKWKMQELERLQREHWGDTKPPADRAPKKKRKRKGKL